VIVPPLGYEYWSAHRTLRTLAETCAARGHHVLRFDLDGTGDSAGDSTDPARLAAWTASLLAAVAEVRARGCTTVTLIGLRFGAALALSIANEAKADRVVAWLPTVSGKRYMQELRMLALRSPNGDLVFAGTTLSQDTVAAVSTLDLAKLPALPAERVLVVTRPGRSVDKLVARLDELGSRAEVVTLAGAHTALEVPAEDATVPEEITNAIAGWLGEAAPATVALPLRRTVTSTRSGVTETIVELAGLTAIVASPAGMVPETTVVFLNSGSEVHVGPGRAWVDYSRALAAVGTAAVRVDWSGWGESPDRGHAPGRPYDPHGIAETVQIVEALRARGAKRVVLAGLCAGAWIAVQTALQIEIDGVIAINPQLYWSPGDPVEALLSDTRKRRVPIRERDARLRAKGVWSALDAIGVRPPAARWLHGLTERRVPSLLLFAESDDGLEYLEMRCERRLRHEQAAGFVQVVQIPDIDHQMYRVWRRGDVIAALRAFTRRKSRSSPSLRNSSLQPCHS
jgi:pimeloyl-ACP methyl ester carboxylesterase